MSNCETVTFPLVSSVRCGAWLYRFLIFALFLIFILYKILHSLEAHYELRFHTSQVFYLGNIFSHLGNPTKQFDAHDAHETLSWSARLVQLDPGLLRYCHAVTFRSICFKITQLASFSFEPPHEISNNLTFDKFRLGLLLSLELQMVFSQ